VKEEAERADVKPTAIVLEPAAHSTAPAIAVAALLVQRIDPAGILVAMPSDRITLSSAWIASLRPCAARPRWPRPDGSCCSVSSLIGPTQNTGISGAARSSTAPTAPSASMPFR